MGGEYIMTGYDDNNMLSYFNMKITDNNEEHVKMEMTLEPRMYGPNGKVSGGLIAALAETAASVGANQTIEREELAFCAQINTDFLMFSRVEIIEAEARLIHAYPSPKQQLWEVIITTDETLIAKSSCIMSIKKKR